jgi:hypothetical protein
MDQQELFGVWQRNKHRPAFVRNYAEEIGEYINTDEPIPEGDSLAATRRWLERYRGTVTRQLKPESGETPTGDAEE